MSAASGPWCRRDERGQATVEFALCLPALTIGLLLLVQVALVVRDQVLVVHAAREAAREAAVSDDPVRAERAARHTPGLRADRLEVDVRGTGAGSEVTAVVRYRAPTDLPLVGALVPEVLLRGQVTMRREAASLPRSTGVAAGERRADDGGPRQRPP
jgi:hypothetical protein